MKRRSLLIMFILFFVFLLVLPAAAQDVTPEPVATIEATINGTPVQATLIAPVVTPAPILTPDNAISISTILYGLIIAVLGGGTVGFVLNRFGSNKANLDSMEKLYLAQSPDAQERERQIFEDLRSITLRVLDIVDKVTDGKPNAEVQALAGSVVFHSDNEGETQKAVESAVQSVVNEARSHGY